MTTTAFHRTPPTPEGHLALHFYAAVLRLILYVDHLAQNGGDDVGRLLSRFAFLKGYRDEITNHSPTGMRPADMLDWWRRETMEWEKAVDLHLPLRALRERAGLAYEATVALMLAGLVDRDSRFGTVLQALQQPLDARRPSLQLLEQILGHAGGGDDGQALRPLLSLGLLSAEDAGAPRSEWAMRVPSVIWDALHGQLEAHAAPWMELIRPDRFPALEHLTLPEPFLQRIAHLVRLIQLGEVRTVVVRGPKGGDRLNIVGAIAAELGLGVLKTRITDPPQDRPTHLLGPVACLLGAIPVLTLELAPGQTLAAPPLGAYAGPTGVVLGAEGGLTGPLATEAVTLTVPDAGPDDRRRAWTQAFGQRDVTDLGEIVRRFRLPPRFIRLAAAGAAAESGLEGAATVTPSHVQRACRALNRQMLDTLAARIETDQATERLVIAGEAAGKLEELRRRCIHREQLASRAGPGFDHAGSGVRALFTGPSGTGKTLGARRLAADLGMDLYRVDLAAVVNKYIGETEKNLHRVLSTAESLDVVLLIDEGDALLSSRTDVRSSNDRYANLETNFLLQRLEQHRGIVIVTTNAGEHIDRAFMRRMDTVVTFAPPRAEERAEIWRLHLPAAMEAKRLWIDDLAARCSMTGGQIRNAALHAVLSALNDGTDEISRDHVLTAIRSEYRKAGAVSPLDQSAAAAEPGAPPRRVDHWLR